MDTTNRDYWRMCVARPLLTDDPTAIITEFVDDSEGMAEVTLRYQQMAVGKWGRRLGLPPKPRGRPPVA